MQHLISKISWGKIKVDSKKFKDLKLYPGGYRAWDWGETGTRHSPGIQPGDLQELIDNGATIIVLSAGMENRLQLPDETKKFLQEKGVTYHYLQSKEAVEKYNELSLTTSGVGALIHSTC